MASFGLQTFTDAANFAVTAGMLNFNTVKIHSTTFHCLFDEHYENNSKK